MIRMSRSCFVAALMAVCSVALGQGEVPLKPALRQGDEFAYAIGMVLDVSQTIGEGQPEQMVSLKASATIRMKVAEVNDDGSARLEGAFEKAMVQAPIGDQPVGFDWPAATPGADAPAVSRLGETLEKATVMIDVDSKGGVVVQGGLEKFAEAAGKLDYPDDRHLGFFTNEKLAGVLTPIFKMDGAWAAPRSVGKGWQHVETIALPPAGAIDMMTEYTVRSADSDTVQCDGMVSMTLKRPENPAADVATITLDPNSGGGAKIDYDRHRMLLGFRKHSVTINTDWVLGNASVRQRQMSVLNIRLVE